MDLLQEVRNAIGGYTGSGKKFTAFNITQDVRCNVGPDEEVGHKTVSLLVTQVFESGNMGSYRRKSEKVDGDKTAWVYQEDPDYKPDAVNGMPVASAISMMIVNPSPPPKMSIAVTRNLFEDDPSVIKTSLVEVEEEGQEAAPTQNDGSQRILNELDAHPVLPSVPPELMDESKLSPNATQKLADIRAHYAAK